jgi:MFS family permease
MILIIMRDLSLSFEEAGIIIGLVPLALVMLCVPSGLFSDRFGFRMPVVVGGTLVGIFGLLRGFSANFLTLAITMFLTGVGYATVYPALPKVIGRWFPVGQYALATGIAFTGMESGMSAAFIMTPAVLLPWAGSWQGVFKCIGILSLALTVGWIVFARDVKVSTAVSEEVRDGGVSSREALSIVGRNRYLWASASISFLLLASQIGFLGFFPAILQLRRIDSATAGLTASMITWFMIPGSFILPKLSDYIGLRKPFFWLASIISGAVLYFTGTTLGLPLWISMMVYGFLGGGMAALALSMPLELVGPSYASTAVGFCLMVGYSGAIFGPWLAGYLITLSGSFVPSVIACIVLTDLVAIAALLLKETGKSLPRE